MAKTLHVSSNITVRLDSYVQQEHADALMSEEQQWLGRACPKLYRSILVVNSPILSNSSKYSDKKGQYA